VNVNRSSSWFVVVTAIFVTTLIVSNIVAVKLVTLGGLLVPAGVIIFPVSYIFGDVLTEVYGFAAARRVIWLGFFCNLVAVVAIGVAGALPPAGFWAQNQAAWDTILGYAPRLLVASFCAYLIGEFANSYVLARLKVATEGRWLWSRTISSTVAGELLDSAVFIILAFVGQLPPVVLAQTALTQWLLKTAYEVVATPLTYAVVTFLKRVEGIDTFDRDTNFSPFAA
jgi:queuosine precursor transporter